MYPIIFILFLGKAIALESWKIQFSFSVNKLGKNVKFILQQAMKVQR